MKIKSLILILPLFLGCSYSPGNFVEEEEEKEEYKSKYRIVNQTIIYEEKIKITRSPIMLYDGSVSIYGIQTKLDSLNIGLFKTVQAISILTINLSFIPTTPEIDFSFLSNAEVHLSTSSIQSQKIGWIDSIPDSCGCSLSFNVTNLDIKSNFSPGKTFNLTLKTKYDKQLPTEQKALLRIVVNVKSSEATFSFF